MSQDATNRRSPQRTVANRTLWARGLPALGVVALLMYAAGPRIQVDPTLRPLDARCLDEVEGYLAECEGRFDDLVPGTEKQVVWRHEDRRRTRYAVVYLHGFSASRQDCLPLPELIAEHLGANVFYTRLTAHGRGPEPFADVSANDWLNDAHEAVQIGKRIGEQVVVVGMSTGATLSLWIASQEPSVAAVVLLSPNFGVAHPAAPLALYPWGNQIARLIQGPYREFTPRNERHARYWTPRQRTEGVVQMIALVDYCCRQDYGSFERPCLVVYCPHDHIVSVPRIQAQFAAIQSPAKRLVALPGCTGHGLAGEILSPETTLPLSKIVADFLDESLQGPL